MICDNTVEAGFYFMAGKFLFDVALTFGVIALFIIFYIIIARRYK